MKTTLEFDLPEEKEELQAALNGSLYKARIDELYDQVFRPHIKYDKPLLHDSQELTEDQLAIIEQLWENVRLHFEDVL
jgi:hypothetical protein